MRIEKYETQVGEIVGIKLMCSDFDDEIAVRYTNKCSPGCIDGMSMFYTPSLQGSTIHAQICAGRWEFVKSLSKEWWARKAASVLGWDESKIREQTDPVWASKVHAANNYGKVGDSNDVETVRCGLCDGPLDKNEKCKTCNSEPVIDDGDLTDLCS